MKLIIKKKNIEHHKKQGRHGKFSVNPKEKGIFKKPKFPKNWENENEITRLY